MSLIRFMPLLAAGIFFFSLPYISSIGLAGFVNERMEELSTEVAYISIPDDPKKSDARVWFLVCLRIWPTCSLKE